MGRQEKGWGGKSGSKDKGEGTVEADVGTEEEEEWDIDTVDSGVYSAESSISASPLRRQMSLLMS